MLSDVGLRLCAHSPGARVFGYNELGERAAYPRFPSFRVHLILFNFAPHSAAALSASLLNSFASGECLAQRRLPTRAELLGGFGVRHEEIESVESSTHD